MANYAISYPPALPGADRRGPAAAKSAAYLIAQAAIDQILDALPELELAVPARELVWRPGPFARGLAALPVLVPGAPPIPVR